MSKTRASKVRSEIQEVLGLEVSYKQIAGKCQQLQIPFKEHSQMGIHYNSVIDQVDSERLVNAFRNQPSKSSAKAGNQGKTQPASQSSAPAASEGTKAPVNAKPVEPKGAQGSPADVRQESAPQSSERKAPLRQEKKPEVRSGGYRSEPRQGAGYRSEPRQTTTAGGYRSEPRQSASPTGGYRSQPRQGGTTGASPSPGGYRSQPRQVPGAPPPGGGGGYRSEPRQGAGGAAPGGYRSAPRQGGAPSRPAARSAGGGRPEAPEPFDIAAMMGGKPDARTRPINRPSSGPGGRPGGGPGGRPGGGPGGRPGGGPGGRPGGGRPPHQRFGPMRGRKGKRSKYRKDRNLEQVVETKVELSPEERILELHHNITVGELAEKLHTGSSDVIKALFMKGMVTNMNHVLELETAEMIAKEMEFEVLMPADTKEEAEAPKVAVVPVVEDEDPADLKPRPPVVTIMGHVDHGKTSLLDYIRETSVTKGEAGGITQQIGAYMVKVGDHPIAFLDTPGHEAFTAMRARGAQVTDIAILVIAADDGIMPQTVEAINHAKAAKVQIIVAVNKMDKPGADLERAKQQLTEHGLVPEEWGGDTVIVPVSAKTGEGVDDLLEMIHLVADVLELKANPDCPAVGVVIESTLEKGRGAVGTVLIQKGTLKQGDCFVVGAVSGKVRAMTNERGTRLKSAGPSIPVEILGFQDVPVAGDLFEVVKNEKIAKAQATKKRIELEDEDRSRNRLNLSNLYENMQEGKLKELNIVVKADVHGSVDAIKQSIERLSNDQVQVRVLHGATGEISQYDIMLATASDALVVGFNVKADNNAIAVSQQENVEIRYYDIIYKLIEDIQNAMEGLLEPEMIEVPIGVAEVRAVFKISRLGTIAGSYMQEGKVVRNAKVRVVRDKEVIFTGKLSSLKRFKEDTREVGIGYECGIGVEGFNDLVEGDKMEFFLIQARHEVSKA